jgi:hypothetical protein
MGLKLRQLSSQRRLVKVIESFLNFQAHTGHTTQWSVDNEAVSAAFSFQQVTRKQCCLSLCPQLHFLTYTNALKLLSFL